VNPLNLRKQLLVAESDLNRAQAVAEWHAVTGGLRRFAGPLKSLGGLAFTVATLAISLFRGGKSVQPREKKSLLHTILENAGHLTSAWLAFRDRLR
jgi:hypothetical protein